MKAVVFAAGVGSRLKPFTDFHPKALAPLAGRPILAHVLDRLIAAGADDIVVNVHHFASQIVGFLASNYPEVRTSDESGLLLDTAGGLAKIFRDGTFARTLTDTEPVIVHNADIYTDFPIADMIAAHGGGEATVLVDPWRKSSRQLLFRSGYMEGWRNNSTGIVRPSGLDVSGTTGAAFGGVHIISGSVLSDISDYVGAIRPVSITDYYIDRCGEIPVRAFTPALPFRWFDIGTPEKLAMAEASVSH